MRFDHRRTRSFIRHMTSAEEHGDLSVRHSGDLEFRAEIVDRSATMEMTLDFPDLCAVPVPGPALSHHIRTQPVCPAIPCRAVPVWLLLLLLLLLLLSPRLRLTPGRSRTALVRAEAGGQGRHHVVSS